MKRYRLAVIAALLLSIASVTAWAKPIGRSAEVKRPLDQTYDSLSKYFAPDSLHQFQIQQADKSSGEIIAKREGVDQNTWHEWAYCSVAASEMLSSLKEGTVTVKVKLDRDGDSHTFVTVTPSFEGIYEFAGTPSTVHCQSNGVLEKDILRAAGASDTELD